MGQRILIVAILICALVFMASPVLAGGNPHLQEAIDHAEEAIKHGGMGHAGAVVEHAVEA